MRLLALISVLSFGALAWNAEPEPHWSLRPPTPSDVPAVRNPQFAVRTPVDAFNLARLTKEGLAPAPVADRATLIRRVTFDLTGLPTPAEVEAFVKDDSPDAYVRLVSYDLAFQMQMLC